MLFSYPVCVVCPEGYLPFARPKEWNNSSTSNSTPSLSFEIPSTDMLWSNTHLILDELLVRISNSFEIQIAYTHQLSKCYENSFICSLTSNGQQDIEKQVSRFISNPQYGNVMISVSLNHIYLFQKIKQKQPL